VTVKGVCRPDLFSIQTRCGYVVLLLLLRPICSGGWGCARRIPSRSPPPLDEPSALSDLCSAVNLVFVTVKNRPVCART